jgi:zinc transport system substrate-binding protein
MPQLSETLIKEFPDFEDQIVRNYASFLEDVDSIDAVFSDLCSGLKHQKFMIFHPALAYLGRDYGLEQISIEYEGKEPSPMKLKEVIDLAREENIRVIFIQAEFDQRSADIVREATGAELVTINPLAYDWMESMNEVFLMFEKHLK